MASYIIYFLLTFLSLRLRLAFGQDYTYLGCFYDDNRREALPDLIYCDRSRHPYKTCQNECGPQSQYCQSVNMTTELCREICADQNMKYFGLQAGSQCFCGGFFAPYNVLDQPTGQTDICNKPCSGNSSQMCGADFQARVYQINEPASDCFNPGYVLNGDQSQQDRTLYNESDVINFTSVCPSPSIKNGAASITCTGSGNWTDPPPTCTVRCATPTEPMHASFRAGQTLNNSYAVNDVVIYDCDNDQTNQSLTCSYYGVWMNSDNCPEPTTTVATTTQPTTAQQVTTMMPSTTSIATPTTSRTSGDGSTTTHKTVVTAVNATASSATQPATTPATTAATSVSAATGSSTGSSTVAISEGSSATNSYQGYTSSTITGPLPGSLLTSGNSPISGPTGPSTTESTTMTMSTSPSTSSTSTDGQTPGAPSSSPSSVTSNEASSSGSMATVMSSPGEQSASTPGPTAGSGMTTVDSGRNQSDDMGLIPIIIGAAAGVLVLILVIIVVSVCCSRKRKQKTKKIPFDPALGTSFGNPAFEDDEAEESRRGFVQENDYGDRQTYDIGVSDYAMAVDETNRVPPEGKDSPGATGDGVEDVAYAVVNKNRQGVSGDGVEDVSYAVVNKNRQDAEEP